VLRKKDPKNKNKHRDPWRDKAFYPIAWPKQAMDDKDGMILLKCGQGRPALKIPIHLDEPFGDCKVVWHNGFERHVCREVSAPQEPPEVERATVDLGQIHQAAVTTTTGKALLMSGRGIHAQKRLRNKGYEKISGKLSRCKKASKIFGKLLKAKHKISNRSDRRCRDLQHKGTAQVIKFCKKQSVGELFVGNPNGVQHRDGGRKQNQRMSQWEFGQDLDDLAHKCELLE
jgi:putative transposase